MIPPKQVYVDALKNAKPDNGAESITCLVLALQQNRKGVAVFDPGDYEGVDWIERV